MRHGTRDHARRVEGASPNVRWHTAILRSPRGGRKPERAATRNHARRVERSQTSICGGTGTQNYAARRDEEIFVTFDRAKVTKARRGAGTANTALDGHTHKAPDYRK